MRLAWTIRLHAFGTSEGAKKGWDTRGRGRKPKEPKKTALSRLLTQVAKKFPKGFGTWNRLAKRGHIGQEAPFTKDELDVLNELRAHAGECKMGFCFQNAQSIAAMAIRDPRVRLMEGLVAVHGVPLDHSWIEFNGKVFDPTLNVYEADQDPARKQDAKEWGAKKQNLEYHGVEVPKDAIFPHWQKTMTYSPLSHEWRDEKLMERIWGKPDESK